MIIFYLLGFVSWDDFYCFVVLFGALKYEMLIQYIMMALNIDIQDTFNKNTLIYFVEFIGSGDYALLKDEMTFIEFIELLKEHQEFYSTLLKIQLRIWKKIKGYNWWKKIQTRRTDTLQSYSLFPCLHHSEIYPIDDNDRYYLLYQILFYFRNRFYPSLYESTKAKNGVGSSYNSVSSNGNLNNGGSGGDDDKLKIKVSPGGTTTTTMTNNNNNSNDKLLINSMTRKIKVVESNNSIGFSGTNNMGVNGSNCSVGRTKLLIHEPPSMAPSMPTTPIQLSASQQKNSNSSKISNSK